MDNKIILKKNQISQHPNDSKRCYHDIEGSFDGYYFFAKTDNSHKLGFANFGINGGSVFKFDLWEGAHPVGRDSIKGKGVHVSKDYVAGYFNKWEVRPRAKKVKLLVDEIIKQLDKIALKKRN